MPQPLLSVQNLKLYYITRKGIVKAVDGVSFTLNKGETLALVGESGCGKSSTARAVMRLLPRNVHTYDGEVLLDGVNIMKISDEKFDREIRWRRISMVFQGALNALNPVLKVGYQIAEPLILHKNLSKEEALSKAREAVKMVGIPEAYIERYPFELSGGMKQRVVIAMALITSPDIIILDEPTSALDVITQANIMNMLKKLQDELNLSYIFITHDIPLSSELADEVATMYAGHIVEIASSATFYTDPAHPYTKMLMASVPTLRGRKKLESIPGEPPSLITPPPGCRFHPRCPHVMDICRREEPKPVDLGEGHIVKCWLYR